MARIYPIHRTDLADPARELLVCALAALPEPWLALCDRRLAPEDQRADAVLVHPELGIALVNPVPNHPAAAGALRRLLERERFGIFFPGELPILALETAGEDPETFAGRLQAAFCAAPRVDIEDSYWADAVVELLLEDADLNMAPIGSQPSRAARTAAAGAAAAQSEPEGPIKPANRPPATSDFNTIRATAVDRVGSVEPLASTEFDLESPVGVADEDWSTAQGSPALAVARYFGFAPGTGRKGRGRLVWPALLAAGIVCALVLPVDLPLHDEISREPGRPPASHEAALPPAADGAREASPAKEAALPPAAGGTQEASPAKEAALPPAADGTREASPAKEAALPPVADGTRKASPAKEAALPPAADGTREASPAKEAALPPVADGTRKASPAKEAALPPAADGTREASPAKDTAPEQTLGALSPTPTHEFQAIPPAAKPMASTPLPVVPAAKPLAAAPPSPPEVTPVEPLPAAPTENSAALMRAPAPLATAVEPAAGPQAKREGAPLPDALSEARKLAAKTPGKSPTQNAGGEKPRRITRAQNPEEIQQPVVHSPPDEGDQGLRPPIDVVDLPPPDSATRLAVPAGPSTTQTAHSPAGATGRPDQALGPPVPLNRPWIQPESGVGASAPPARPAQSAAAEPPAVCVPYMSDKSLLGGRGPVQGTACRDPEGHWRVVSEAPQR
jgi:hypothetical protein